MKLANVVVANIWKIKSESQLVLYQFTKIYDVKELILKKYCTEVKNCVTEFYKVEIEQILTEAIEEAEYLVNKKEKPIIELSKPSYESLNPVETVVLVGNIKKERDS